MNVHPGRGSKGKPRFPWPLEKGQGENHSEGFPLARLFPHFLRVEKMGPSET